MKRAEALLEGLKTITLEALLEEEQLTELPSFPEDEIKTTLEIAKEQDDAGVGE